MHIIDACQKNSKRKCGESVKNLPIFVVTMPSRTQFFQIFRGPGKISWLRRIFLPAGATLGRAGGYCIRDGLNGRPEAEVAIFPRMCYNIGDCPADRI